jgi:hypothetical protein
MPEGFSLPALKRKPYMFAGMLRSMQPSEAYGDPLASTSSK